jgi:hypothetical protein
MSLIGTNRTWTSRRSMSAVEGEADIETALQLRNCRLQFPDTLRRFPVPRTIFPVNSLREILEKSLRHSGFWRRCCLRKLQNYGFPCKIPCLQGIGLETGAISTASPATQSFIRTKFATCASQARKSRLFAHSLLSLHSGCTKSVGEIAKSLRPRPRIFPFCGDYRRRPS